MKQRQILQIATFPLVGLLWGGVGERLSLTANPNAVRFLLSPLPAYAYSEKPVVQPPPVGDVADENPINFELISSATSPKDPDPSEWEERDTDDSDLPASPDSSEEPDNSEEPNNSDAPDNSDEPDSSEASAPASDTEAAPDTEPSSNLETNSDTDTPSAPQPSPAAAPSFNSEPTPDTATPSNSDTAPSSNAEPFSAPERSPAEPSPDVEPSPEPATAPADADAINSRPGRRPSTPIELPGQERRAPTLPARRPWEPAENAADTPADPAEQIEPAVIEIAPNTRTLSPFLALAMQRELRNLIGRFESALLMTNSLDMTTTLAVVERSPVLTAAAEDVNLSSNAHSEFLHPALASAQELLNDWDELIDSGKHREAQERWLAAREALWENFPDERPFAQAEIRAVWLDRGTIVEARSPERLAAIFDRLADAGITTVFFETVNAGYPIYPSRIAPQQNPLTAGWDPLAAAVDLAHQRNMTLHAWVWVFAAGNERHNRLLNLPADYPGPLLSLHPDWAGYDNTGNRIPRGQDKPFLDPANPEVRSYLTRLMTEIVSEYDVDGLHLDYIRYPFQDPGANRTYGYGEVARWRFRSISGVDPLDLTPRPGQDLSQSAQIQQRVLWDRWTEFRIQQINSFVETISTTLRRQRSDLILSAAVFAKPEHERLQKIQQDWGTWARNGYVDWIVLMSYAEDTSRFSQLINPWLIDEDFNSALVIPGIRLLPLEDAAAVDQIQVTRDLPTPGYALFAAADLQANLETILANTQANTSSIQSPFQIALGRYQALQREWNWLLSQQRLWMDHSTLTQWVEAVNTLGTDFQSLADDPSHRQLEAVTTGLEAVRSPLNDRILIETANSSYRLQSWQYRLTAIEQLLDYGERTEF